MLAKETLFLGDDLLPWLLLAFGAAMVVGNLAAYFRPPPVEPGDLDEPRQPPALGRTVAFVVVGGIAAIWALASLLK
jgi:hypothetical protein